MPDVGNRPPRDPRVRGTILLQSRASEPGRRGVPGCRGRRSAQCAVFHHELHSETCVLFVDIALIHQYANI